MRIAGIVVAGLLAGGCALNPVRGLEPGKSTAGDVRGRLGEPAMSLDRPDGGRELYFTHWPWGTETYVATVGSDGVLRELSQRLTYENIYGVRAGMSKEEVRRLLGPPVEVSRLPRQQRDVWEYPWRHAVRERRVLFVQFSDDGLVSEAIHRHDFERDPEGDPLP